MKEERVSREEVRFVGMFCSCAAVFFGCGGDVVFAAMTLSSYINNCNGVVFWGNDMPYHRSDILFVY